MKKIIGLIAVLAVLSCEVQYDGNTRYIAKTIVVDKNGIPIKDIQVDVNSREVDRNYDDNIASATTDDKGFSMHFFPSLQESGTYSIVINPEGNIYQTKSISNIKLSDFENFVFESGPITLYKNEDIVNFQIKLYPINENHTIESIEIDAISANDRILYNDMPNDDDYYYPENSFKVLKNQNFNIIYKVRDHSTNPTTLTDYSVNVSIGSESLTYELEY
jgi:hypothetical protein